VRAREFLAKNNISIVETAMATKDRRGSAEALALAHSVDRVVVARGKVVHSFDMKRRPPDDATLLRHLLGPTGNLRAPTMLRGRELWVGFFEPEFDRLLSR
jgi:hypothetical protein